MTSWVESHNEAMGLTSDALRERRRGNHDIAQGLFEKALSFEREALELMKDVVDEPIYSTMYRSAATLALDCKRYRLAEQLAWKALAGNPPGYLISELLEVTDQARFYTSLARNGIELGQGELSVSVSGALVSHGQALWTDIVPRFEGVRRLLSGMWDFAAGRDHGDRSSTRSGGASIVIGALVPGSVAVKMSIGQPEQARFASVGGMGNVIEKTLLTVGAVDKADESELASLVPDNAYRRAFVNHVKDIAPDGDRVSQVGFTSIVDGKTLQVPLRRTKASFGVRSAEEADPQPKSIVGRLQYADGLRKTGDQIKIIDKDYKLHQVEVPAGKIDDIVARYWKVWVEAKCVQAGNTLTLDQMAEVDAPLFVTEEMDC